VIFADDVVENSSFVEIRSLVPTALTDHNGMSVNERFGVKSVKNSGEENVWCGATVAGRVYSCSA